uniref:C-type lectin domain-containing protein n=1 Tax=Acrobeloides nanus TaxID=290746 RepID=A0A914DKH8_9BILA
MVINNRDSANNYTITVNDASINGKGLTLNLEASSFTTIVWNAPAACSCPSGAWYQSSVNPCNCYNFIKTPKDWTSANNDCQQQDPRSTLTSIDSAFENNEVL